MTEGWLTITTIVTIVSLTSSVTVWALMSYIDAKIDPLVYQIKKLLDDLQIVDSTTARMKENNKNESI